MERVVPFTESATAEETEALRMILFLEALLRLDIEFASIEKHNRFMEASLKILEDFESADEMVELTVGEEGVTLSLSEEAHQAQQDYLDEHGPVEMD